jgi:hypothetical protein
VATAAAAACPSLCSAERLRESKLLCLHIMWCNRERNKNSHCVFQAVHACLQARLSKLRASNADLAEMVEHMIRLEPENRLSVNEYLQKWPKEVFPAFFGPLHDLLSPLMTWAQDHSVLLLKTSFSGFLTRLQHMEDPEKRLDEKDKASQPAHLPGEGEGSSAAYDDRSGSRRLNQPTLRSPSPVRSLNSQHAAKDEAAASTSADGVTQQTHQPESQPQGESVPAGMRKLCRYAHPQ